MCALFLTLNQPALPGMENPNSITVTPTLLAGDRSLEDVIAHELAHSWCRALRWTALRWSALRCTALR